MFRDDPPALELRGLTKQYDDGTLALEDFNLEIHSGAFFGLLGPNGAGKTTLISAVCNLLRVTEGEVLVFGQPHDTLEARSWVGLAEQDINLDRFLTVRETLEYHGGYFGMDKDEIEDRAEEMIRAFGLTSKRDVRAPKLSGGQRRRLLLARALMHRPRLVILDEPTAGVDFELRQELWNYIRRLHSEGTTILLTTHYLDEAERRAEEMIEVFGLASKRDVRAPRLSGGQRRRLLLARALMHRPRLVILDEPTAGVDVELRAELWRYIDRLHAEGTTILLTTHYLEEAENLCEEIALIHNGHLIARDTADGLRRHFDVDRLTDVYVKAMAEA